jgi:actin related protein 2/3 complex subunit 1A/1B
MKVSGGVMSMSWNLDRSQVAIATNTTLVEIYTVTPSGWTKSHTLSEHDQLVAAVDWHGETNRILSASHDRNAYVWEFNGTRWIPNLVILKNRRAILDATWSRPGTKIALGTGGKKVVIGRYNPDLSAWSTKLLSKVHTSAVTCLRFHPSGLYVASGGTDGICNVTSCYLEIVDGPQPGVPALGELMYTVDLSRVWINALSWSLDGLYLAIAGHNSTVTFFSLTTDARTSVTWPGRPFSVIEFVGNDKAIAGGWDFVPVEINKSSDRWLIGNKLDGEDRSRARTKSLVQSMKNQFERVEDVSMASIHQGLLTCIRHLGGNKVATADVTGLVHVWTLA